MGGRRGARKEFFYADSSFESTQGAAQAKRPTAQNGAPSKRRRRGGAELYEGKSKTQTKRKRTLYSPEKPPAELSGAESGCCREPATAAPETAEQPRQRAEKVLPRSEPGR